jgi:luciferase family oxidoreductase group 1
MSANPSPAEPGGLCLSVLEIVPILPGQPPQQAIELTTEVAKVADQLGFHRFWLAEHHGVPHIGSAAPTMLMAHFAAHTTSIRIGSGGVMLTNHSPLVVAEQFAVLEALYPGRIDLGVGRAPGGRAATLAALGVQAGAADRFAAQLDEVRGLLGQSVPDDRRYRGVRVALGSAAPPVYVLATSADGARAAAARGLPVMIGHHLRSANTADAVRAYRAEFVAAPDGAPLRVTVSVVVVAADSNAAARSRLTAFLRNKLRLASVADAPMSTTDELELLRRELTADEQAKIEHHMADPGYIVGDELTVATELRKLRDETDADELMLLPVGFSARERCETLTRVAATGVLRVPLERS